MDEKVLKQIAQGLDSKNAEAVKAYENLQKVAAGNGAEAQKAKVIIQKINSYRTKKAAHGTKLEYFRTLKNQCPEGEELVYYKKGGQVNCGCKKKEGGEIENAKKGTAIDKFKARKAEPGMKMLSLVESRKGRQNAQDEAAKRKLAEERKRKTWGATSMVIGKDIQPGSGNDTSKQGEAAAQYYLGLGYHKQGSDQHPKKTEKKACGSKLIKDKKGSAIAKFKAAKCGSKLKKHLQGGSLNRIPFMQAGTPKGGIEKSDNTRVQKISNKGEGVYEQIPMNGWDFVPLVGTYREAQRLDQEDPNASKLGFATSMGMDLLGAGMVGPAIKATAKASRLSKLLKSRGFNKITEQGLYRSQPNTYMKVAPETIKHQYYNVTQPTVRFKQVPTVDVSGIALSPLVQTLRVPTQAMAH